MDLDREPEDDEAEDEEGLLRQIVAEKTMADASLPAETDPDAEGGDDRAAIHCSGAAGICGVRGGGRAIM